MEVILDKVTKRFAYQTIIRKLDYHFESHKMYGISGPNGSGKSTLLKMILGATPLTSGQISFRHKTINSENVKPWRHVTVAAPYGDLIDQFSLRELVDFTLGFRTCSKFSSAREFCVLIQADYDIDKRLDKFSSGMIQKVKLGLALTLDAELVLLDEPTSFLDNKAQKWFLQFLEEHCKNKTVLIGSNQTIDFELCDARIDAKSWS